MAFAARCKPVSKCDSEMFDAALLGGFRFDIKRSCMLHGVAVSEAEDDARTEAEIILAAVHAIVEECQIIVHIGRANKQIASNFYVHSYADRHREGEW
jgi:hypothetical protein